MIHGSSESRPTAFPAKEPVFIILCAGMWRTRGFNMLLYKSKLISTALLLLGICLSLCGCSKEKAEASTTVEQVTMVLQAEEINKLDQYPALKSADLSGSTCYREILDWAAAHPQTAVTYTVTFPDGTVADNHTETLNLSGLSGADIETAAGLLPWLPGLRELVLTPGSFTPEQVSVLHGAAPQLALEYRFTIEAQEIDYFAESADFSHISGNSRTQALALLSSLPDLKHVNLGAEESGVFTWEDIYSLRQSKPELDIDYSFWLYGKPVSLSDTEIDLSYIPVDDNGLRVFQAARCMPELRYLDMDSCGLSNETMAQLRAELPNTKVVWRVFFGQSYTVRTDVERILASKPSAGGFVGDADAQVLKYCEDVKYLDLGHNEFLTDISFVASMPKLEVAILAMNRISDLSPLAHCPELEYLEVQTNSLSDLSPLANCTKLAHLNLAHNLGIADIRPLMELTALERFWLGSGTGVDQAQIDEFIQKHPDCELDLHVFADPTAGHWRIIDINFDSGIATCHPRYELLQEQLGYLEDAYAFFWNDPKYRAPGS